MRRRDFIGGLLVTAKHAQAQQTGKVYRIAIVSPSAPLIDMNEAGPRHWWGFLQELRRLGYIEGQNLVLERYSGEGRTEHYAELATEVVRSAPDLIFAVSFRMVRHFKEATATIPIVGYTVDPVALGFATSLARPGGNLTGVDPGAGIEVWDKLLELLREAVPTASRVAYLAPRAVWEGAPGVALRKVAQRTGVLLIVQLLNDPIREAEYRRVFAAMAEDHADALLVSNASENYTHRRLIVELAETRQLPTVYPNRVFVEAGGLMAYGIDLAETFRYAAGQIDQILKGAKPGEIPFYQATKFELVINPKTVKRLGIEMPSSLLARADEVIE